MRGSREAWTGWCGREGDLGWLSRRACLKLCAYFLSIDRDDVFQRDGIAFGVCQFISERELLRDELADGVLERGEPLFSRAPLGLGLILGPLEYDRGGYRVGLRFSFEGFEPLRFLGEGQFFGLGDVQISLDRMKLFDDRVVLALSDAADSGDDGESDYPDTHGSSHRPPPLLPCCPRILNLPREITPPLCWGGSEF